MAGFSANLAHGDVATMIDAIVESTAQTAYYTEIEEIDGSVLDVLENIDRAEFVPNFATEFAFENRPLPIGHGQTISQPFIVALMTHVLEVSKEDKVLEIGTGSGYQAAVLAELADHVYTIEIVEELAISAEARLKRLGYQNISVKAGDGWYGWPEHSMFDKIIVTAVAPSVPPLLVDQLRPGGLMILPVGDPEGAQSLVLVTKKPRDEFAKREILPVVFVPMTGEGVLTVPKPPVQ